MKTKGTPVYTRQQKHGLTLSQQSAVDLLVTGKNDRETAEALNLSRTCVTKWRLYDPVFQAALNQRRAEVWGAGCDRLRALVPKALDALADDLDNRDSPNRLKAAVEVLKMAQLPALPPTGSTDAEDIVSALVRARIDAKRAERSKYLSDTDRMIESMRSPSPKEYEAEEMEAQAEVLAELEAKLNGETGS